MRSRSRSRVAVIVVAVVLAAAAPVSAAWISAGSVSGGGRATSVATAATPTTSVAGRTATVAWTATTLVTGAPVTGYRVTRVDTVTAATAAATGGCSGTVTTPSCVETLLPTGRWAYRIQAVRGAWVGPLGAQGPTIAVDATAPTISAAVLQKTTGGAAAATGAIRQGGTYRVYANVADTGDPATGVATVVANLSALTTGSTSATMTSGSFTVGSVTYGYRSAQLTATNPQAEGAKSFTVTATDAATNSTSPQPFPVVVDNTRPAGADVQVINGGPTPGKAETGDVVRLTYTEALDPNSVLAGWNGGATTVTVRLTSNGGGDRLQVWSASGSTLPLGTVFLTDTGYVTATRDFTGSTMERVGSVVVITLGSPSGVTGTVTTPSTATWTPSSSATDPAGNTSTTTSVIESGPVDVQF